MTEEVTGNVDIHYVRSDNGFYISILMYRILKYNHQVAPRAGGGAGGRARGGGVCGGRGGLRPARPRARSPGHTGHWTRGHRTIHYTLHTRLDPFIYPPWPLDVKSHVCRLVMKDDKNSII